MLNRRLHPINYACSNLLDAKCERIDDTFNEQAKPVAPAAKTSEITAPAPQVKPVQGPKA